MSWMKYNSETDQIDLMPYISELSDFQAIVMEEHAWSVICKRFHLNNLHFCCWM